MKEYIEWLMNTHRAIRQVHINNGKTYRSHKVSFENGYLTALQEILDAINEPERVAKLREAMSKLATNFREQG